MGKKNEHDETRLGDAAGPLDLEDRLAMALDDDIEIDPAAILEAAAIPAAPTVHTPPTTPTRRARRK